MHVRGILVSLIMVVAAVVPVSSDKQLENRQSAVDTSTKKAFNFPSKVLRCKLCISDGRVFQSFDVCISV